MGGSNYARYLAVMDKEARGAKVEKPRAISGEDETYAFLTTRIGLGCREVIFELTNRDRRLVRQV